MAIHGSDTSIKKSDGGDEMKRRTFIQTIAAAALAGPLAGIAGSKEKEEGEIHGLPDLLNSVGEDHLLVRRQADKWWVILHREPKTKAVEYGSGGYRVHHDDHAFMVVTITQDINGKMKLFELWRIK